MPAEAIAKVVRDIRAGRVADPLEDNTRMHEAAVRLAQLDQPVIDVSAVYRAVDLDSEINLYGVHPSIAPPWDAALYGFENKHGNVFVMASSVTEPERDGPWWETENEEDIDWSRCRWQVNTFVFSGGRSQRAPGPQPTAGPVFVMQFAVYEDGAPADLHWVQLLDAHPAKEWTLHQLVLLGALNFLNCRNVEIAEPRRPNAQRKRIARTGVTVNTINVFPTGKSTKGAQQGAPLGTVHASVRGHFAEYGERYGKGLLFGKHEGRFFIPQHARGNASVGESVQEFVLHPEDSE